MSSASLTPVLIVTPYFAPQSHAAVFRAYKIAKLLPDYGYRPVVVTVDGGYGYPEDQGLLEALPPDLAIERALYIEPTLRGIRRLLGVEKKPREVHSFEGAAPLAQRPPLSSALRSFFIRGLFRVPDRYWTWFGPAFVACRRAVREHGIRLVFTSSDPFTTYLLGIALRKEGLRWVADLRDPPTHGYYMHSAYPWVYAIQRALEESAIRNADAVTVAARSIALILAESYRVDLTNKVHFIPTGLDEDLLDSSEALPDPPEGKWILFSGEFLTYYSERFFGCFASALSDPEVAKLGYKLLIVGRQDVNQPRVLPLIARHGLRGHVHFLPHQSQQVLYQLIRKSEFGLLPYGDLSRWWCLAAKLVDYLALQKPVLAMVPNPSEARSRLSEAGLGIFLDGTDQEVGQRLISALRGGGQLVKPDPRVCERYTARRQVQQFARVFDGVLAAAGSERNG